MKIDEIKLHMLLDSEEPELYSVFSEEDSLRLEEIERELLKFRPMNGIPNNGKNNRKNDGKYNEDEDENGFEEFLGESEKINKNDKENDNNEDKEKDKNNKEGNDKQMKERGGGKDGEKDGGQEAENNERQLARLLGDAYLADQVRSFRTSYVPCSTDILSYLPLLRS